MSWRITPSFTQWTPALITTALWLDAADASTVTTVSGAVSQWNDKSGNGYHATQSTSGSRPTYTSSGFNSRSVITFDGANDFFDHPLSLSGSSTIIAVVNKLAGGMSEQGLIFFTAPSTRLDNCIWVDEFSTSNWGSYASSWLSSGASVSSSPSILCSISDNPPSGTLSLYTNGAITASASSSGRYSGDSLDRRNIGSEGAGIRYLNGSIGEIVVLASAANLLARQKLEGYLAHKWGLTANLPADHPYKVNPPAP